MKTISKYLTAVVGILASVAALSSCGNPQGKQGTLAEAVDSLKGRQALVLYYSRAGENYVVGHVEKGNTAFIAEYIAEATGADLCEVHSQTPYDEYSYETMLNTILEEKENGVQPAFAADLPDAAQYEVVFIGGPIWWGTYPSLMFTLFSQYDLNGKILVPFTTNEGSGLGHTVADLKHVYPDARVLEGFTITGHEARLPEAREAVRQWLAGFSYDTAEKAADVDGTTGATPMHKGLTDEGKKSDKTVMQPVVVKRQDGSEQTIELAVQGSVDMGEGVLWNVTNIGAGTPWETGCHFAWGEAQQKESYTEDNYRWHGKDLGSDIGGTWYDAATQHLGGEWRIPTYDEWHSLIVHCTKEYVELNGVLGSLFTAKNGNRLFFPANGYVYGSETYTPDEGFYWASTNSGAQNACVTYLPKNSYGQSNYAKSTGIGVRAVMAKE